MFVFNLHETIANCRKGPICLSNTHFAYGIIKYDLIKWKDLNVTLTVIKVAFESLYSKVFIYGNHFMSYSNWKKSSCVSKNNRKPLYVASSHFILSKYWILSGNSLKLNFDEAWKCCKSHVNNCIPFQSLNQSLVQPQNWTVSLKEYSYRLKMIKP